MHAGRKVDRCSKGYFEAFSETPILNYLPRYFLPGGSDGDLRKLLTSNPFSKLNFIEDITLTLSRARQRFLQLDRSVAEAVVLSHKTGRHKTLNVTNY